MLIDFFKRQHFAGRRGKYAIFIMRHHQHAFAFAAVRRLYHKFTLPFNQLQQVFNLILMFHNANHMRSVNIYAVSQLFSLHFVIYQRIKRTLIEFGNNIIVARIHTQNTSLTQFFRRNKTFEKIKHLISP